MAASPTVLISDGGPFVPMTGGVDIASGATVSIKLADTTDVVTWRLQVLSTDELSTAPPLTDVNPSTHVVLTPVTVVTFSNPSGFGRAFIFQTSVDDALLTTTTTFSLYTLTTFGTRIPAADEEKQSNPVFGWATITNPYFRAGALALQGVAIDTATPSFGDFLTYDGSMWTPTVLPPGFTAGDDLSGTVSAQTVVGIQGVPVLPTVPTSGYILTFNGTQWAPAAPAIGFTAGGDLTGTSSSQTVSAIQGVVVTGSAAAGYALTATSPTAATWSVIPPGFTAGGDLTGTNTSQTVSAIQGVVITGVAAFGYALTATSPTAATWTAIPPGFTAGGDLTGTSSSQTVSAIQGVVITGTPANRGILVATSPTAAAWVIATNVIRTAVGITAPSGRAVVVRVTGTGSSRTITTNASPVTGDTLAVQGASDSAAFNTNITLGGGYTANGSASTIVINVNFDWRTLIFDGTEWGY